MLLCAFKATSCPRALVWGPLTWREGPSWPMATLRPNMLNSPFFLSRMCLQETRIRATEKDPKNRLHCMTVTNRYGAEEVTHTLLAESRAETQRWMEAFWQHFYDMSQWKHCCDELMKVEVPSPRRPPALLPKQGSLYHEMGEPPNAGDLLLAICRGCFDCDFLLLGRMGLDWMACEDSTERPLGPAVVVGLCRRVKGSPFYSVLSLGGKVVSFVPPLSCPLLPPTLWVYVSVTLCSPPAFSLCMSFLSLSLSSFLCPLGLASSPWRWGAALRLRGAPVAGQRSLCRDSGSPLSLLQ
uniref:PH domain-containing protein n=1 Tax=Anolis carolinensis TaxID=28377 RepID=A0A803TWJ7_ANOCA